MVHMFTRQLLCNIVDYERVFADSAENDWVGVEECGSDGDCRDGINGGFGCRGVVAWCGGGCGVV
ncbi:hypothetical protein HanIR_Chr04g0194181 [Helianthus annuus]|nr:hypothetical protein HanIR_Chr04g0194181 [Helianthus annuus]